MAIETIVAPVGKSDLAFDLLTYIIFGGISEAKINKFLDCLKSGLTSWLGGGISTPSSSIGFGTSLKAVLVSSSVTAEPRQINSLTLL